MTVRLTVQRAAWEAHVAAVAGAVDGLLPVVKGNGYGFGRPMLHALAAPLADHVCVGTVHELDHLAADTTPIVLTPTLVPPPTLAPILTVGALEHVAALAGWPGRVVVKLRSSMRRFGVTPDALANLLDAAAAAGLAVEGAALHLPLAGDDHDRIAEIEAWLAVLPDELDLSVSHLSPDLVRRAPARPPASPAAPARRHGAVARRQVVPPPRRRRARRAAARRGAPRRLPRDAAAGAAQRRRHREHRGQRHARRPHRRRHRQRGRPARRRSQPVPLRRPSPGARRAAAHAHRRCASRRAINRSRASATSSTSNDR